MANIVSYCGDVSNSAKAMLMLEFALFLMADLVSKKEMSINTWTEFINMMRSIFFVKDKISTETLAVFSPFRSILTEII